MRLPSFQHSEVLAEGAGRSSIKASFVAMTALRISELFAEAPVGIGDCMLGREQADHGRQRFQNVKKTLVYGVHSFEIFLLLLRLPRLVPEQVLDLAGKGLRGAARVDLRARRGRLSWRIMFR